MEQMEGIVRCLLSVFWIYTVVFVLQWLLGLWVSVSRLKRFRDNKQTVQKMLPDPVAEHFPVSVIIPAYNEASCIKDTIDFLLCDDHPRLQIIVVDDGSTDETAQIVREAYGLRRCSPSFRPELKTKPVKAYYEGTVQGRQLILICKENGGKADTLNCGINASSCPYCVILDADTKVERGAIRILESRFLMDPSIIVCAGAVKLTPPKSKQYRKLNVFQKALVWFQQLEYYRTFYWQRIFFDRINANIIVSGAFAMFDSQLLRKVGGYKADTIGEDMELTMRLHAFCHSNSREYQIAYMPEAACITQVPFHYSDYFQQRRRWHIGMIQSLNTHFYMLANRHYGWAGILSGTFYLCYELLAPIIELVGIASLLLSSRLHILNLGIAVQCMIWYGIMILLTYGVFLKALHHYGVLKLSWRQRLELILLSSTELVLFHPLNSVIKIIASCSFRQNQTTWKKIRRYTQTH